MPAKPIGFSSAAGASLGQGRSCFSSRVASCRPTCTLDRTELILEVPLHKSSKHGCNKASMRASFQMDMGRVFGARRGPSGLIARLHIHMPLPTQNPCKFKHHLIWLSRYVLRNQWSCQCPPRGSSDPLEGAQPHCCTSQRKAGRLRCWRLHALCHCSASGPHCHRALLFGRSARCSPAVRCP